MDHTLIDRDLRMEHQRKLISLAPQVGEIIQMGVRPKRREPLVPVNTLHLDHRNPDHAKAHSARAVTLINIEHVRFVESILGRTIEPLLLRRNLIVSGINLSALVDERFSVGQVVLEGTRLCDPCDRMEALLGPGGHAAMVGHGGICARIITVGTVRVGDAVKRMGPATHRDE
jgi:MOSC domain-containing protein YiiM